jgi:hypothetical protein
MLTHKHNNRGGCAAAESHYAPRRVRGPNLQPQGSLTRSLPRWSPTTKVISTSR